MHLWLPGYLIRKVRPKRTLTAQTGRHLLFCFVDHFEPGWNKASATLQDKRVDAWRCLYPPMASNYCDAEGCHPRHTWFYPPHYYREDHLLKLQELCSAGYGEIEMHLHHNRMKPFPDTRETLKKKIEDCIATYSSFGVFRPGGSPTEAHRYAFIHGDWALANGRAGYCGVNDEIAVLRETGCYADFTFPAYLVSSQPRMVNSIYYATSDPARPKSYDHGTEAAVGKEAGEGLLMVQGPIGLRWGGRRRWLPTVDYGEISSGNPPSPARVDFWAQTGIHVRGREEWVIVKVFAHGAPEGEHAVLLGDAVRSMHNHLRDQYNDGRHWSLHYVTARELFNIIKAAEAGEQGNPGKMRDYLIAPYGYAPPPQGST
ncbi:MAG: hypothetical protein ACYC99_02080 [Candidatus Geothermincolia bacterium]